MLRCLALTTVICSVSLTVHAADEVEVTISTQKAEIQEAVTRDADGTTQKVTIKKSEEKPDVSGGPKAVWIWNEGAAAQTCFLRREFSTNAKSAALIASCDNGMTLFFNGKRVAASDSWNTPVTVDVSKQLKNGSNEIVVHATNEGSVGGFVLKLAMKQADGSTEYLISDASWSIAKDKDFSDAYRIKTLGEMGVGPWNNVFANPGGSGNSLLKSSVPRGVFQVLPGFQVELLYEVPKDVQGSWVCLTTDDKGRLYASDQLQKGLFRITPAPIGSDEPTKVEDLNVGMTSAQGMLWAFDSLYVSANGGPGSGLYRLTDTDDDDQLDKVTKLKAFQGGGEHGPHGLRLSPDGESIYVIAGNHTNPPENFDTSRIRSNWSEDLLLPRQWDARGHARGKLAPGGWVAKTDPEGKAWEVVSIGYRNPYDFDFSPEGELFAYDADMEWDMGTSWYRPTRINHVVSGSEFGWRSGTGKWPTYNIDSLPQVVDIGPGSPVGVTFGTGAKFPAKYQRALYCCDWTFGTMYCVHLTPQGASYVGEKEEFVGRTPLPLTDAAVGADGALYFTIGGRGAQSALYRVTYIGDESTTPAQPENDEFAEFRAVRRKLEALHVDNESSQENVDFVWPYLSYEDRHIRYAARTALEFQEPKLWQERVLAEKDTEALITAAVAFARQGSSELAGMLTERLVALDFAQLDDHQKLEFLRALSLVFIRLGEPDVATRLAVNAQLEKSYPAKSPPLNRELSNVLVYVNSPKVIEKTLALLKSDGAEQTEVTIPEYLARNSGYGGTVAQMLVNQVNLDQMHYAFALRNMKYGWTLEQRREYLGWYGDAAKKSGGASYQGFLKNMQSDWLALATDAERKALESQVAQNAPKEADLPKPKGPGREWNAAELLTLIKAGLSGRSFEGGKRAFAASRCISCHRYAGEGGSTGPDLSNVAGRFSFKDLLESTIDPSKVVSDQYRGSIVTTESGKVYNGRILNDADGKLLILTDPVDITKTVEIDRGEVDEITPSPISLMPQKLLNVLNEDEVLDLLAYLMSRGNPEDPVFTKE